MSHYRSGAMRQFLQNATQLQLFKQVPGLPRLVRVWGPGGVYAAASSLSTEAEDMDGTQCKEAQGLGRETESEGCLATRQCLCKYAMQFYKLS